MWGIKVSVALMSLALTIESAAKNEQPVSEDLVPIDELTQSIIDLHEVEIINYGEGTSVESAGLHETDDQPLPPDKVLKIKVKK